MSSYSIYLNNDNQRIVRIEEIKGLNSLAHYDYVLYKNALDYLQNLPLDCSFARLDSINEVLECNNFKNYTLLTNL